MQISRTVAFLLARAKGYRRYSWPGLTPLQLSLLLTASRWRETPRYIRRGTDHRVDLATRGWKVDTSFVERLDLDFRQHVAAIGGASTHLKHEAVLRDSWRSSRCTTI